jgi:hypothetical protein
MISKIFLASILTCLVVLPTSLIYASGPRADYDEAYQNVLGGADCWIDGYDAGFSRQYDNKRAADCYDLGDQYNRSWGFACRDGGHTNQTCDDARNNPTDLADHEQLQEENRRSCYDDGYEDGKDHPHDKERSKGCREYSNSYYLGFLAGCESVEGNTWEICESATDA